MTDPIARAAEEVTFLSTMFGSLASPEATPEQKIHSDAEIVILSGFLGAGKTTFLRRILSAENGKNVGVIVNDFGSVNLDADTLSETSDGVVSLPNGCSCCTIGSGFTAALRAMLTQPNPPDHVYVEASGVSDPVSMMTLAELTHPTGATSVVTLVDCQTFGSQPLPYQIQSVFERQVKAAHLVLLTKTVAAGEEKTQSVRAAISNLTEGRMVLDADADDTAYQMVLRGQLGGARPTLIQRDHDISQITTCTVPVTNPVLRETFVQLLDQIPETILRLKGSLQLTDGDTITVQCVGPQTSMQTADQKDEAEHCLVAIFTGSDSASTAQWLDALRKI